MLDTLKSKDQQSCIESLSEGFGKLSAIEMHRVLQECAYEHQRPISERHVQVLADLMARAQWQPKSQIDFAVIKGRYILINGYHRAYAQVRSGKAIEWSIALHPCKTEADVRALYYAFDTNVRIRQAQDILRAYEFAESTGLPPQMARALYAAVPFIASRFEVNPRLKDNLITKAVDRRLGLAGEYVKAAGRYSACLDGMREANKKRFLSGAVAAVAVITFRYQSETAWKFWSGVAQNDGLKRGDARHALVMDMFSRTRQKGTATVHAFAPAMIAWNAFFEDRPIQLIRVVPEKFVPVIAGTPFDGKPVKG
jgi:hypothetical protein